MYDFQVRRIIREDCFEYWFLYVSKDEEDLYTDSVIIFFKEKKSIIYLLTAYPERLACEKYGTILEGLYHDLNHHICVLDEEVDIFDLRVEELPKELLLQNENLFDEYVEGKIAEIRKKMNM